MFAQKPLTGIPSSFRTRSIHSLSEILETTFGASITGATMRGAEIDGRGVRSELPSTALWSCSYGPPIRVKFPGGDQLRIQFQRRGLGATHAGKEVIAIDERQSCIFAGDAEVDFGNGYVQVAWRVPIGVLQTKLAVLTGCLHARPLSLDPVLNLTTPQAQSMVHVLNSLLGMIDAVPLASTTLLRTELESALLVALLCAARHNYSDVLERGVPSAAPWQVHRVESFIDANWNKPITIDDMVAASGTSARSLFRTFRQSRGYTPFQFVKQARLRNAKRLLESSDSTTNVTEVALACGFSDLSRFSKDFFRAFGTIPSTLLQRKR